EKGKLFGLKHNNGYTIVIHPALIKDRKGHPLALQDGTLVTADLPFHFNTENISANIAVGSFIVSGAQFPGDFSTVFGQPPAMHANDVLQLAFWSPVDLNSFTF